MQARKTNSNLGRINLDQLEGEIDQGNGDFGAEFDKKGVLVHYIDP